MDFELTEEQKMIRQAARDFTERVLKPGVIERDETQTFPHEAIQELGQLGFMGLMVDPEYGGGGMDTISYVLAIEEISKVDASTSVVLSVNNSLVCYSIEKYGTPEQKEAFLKPLAKGEKIGAFCLSEPEAGSDASSQHTIAEDKGDYYLLNGTKNWITNGSTAGYYLVFAQTDPKNGHRGITAFILERGLEGFSIGPKENKMGVRGSDTHSLLFSDVRIPKANRLGVEGEGFKIAMKALEGGRIGIAAQALGIASGAYALAHAYALQRKSFGKLLIDHQAIQFKLSDMATDIEAARLLCLQAAWMKDKNLPFSKTASMAKLFSSEVAMRITTEAVQIHGGYGYVKEYHVERLMRDAKITQIYEGTSEIQKLVIGRAISKGE